MEKLIELLNKHRREKVNKQSGITEWHYNAFTFSLDNISGQQAELLIISKQYGFIKWLVENEKIEWEKVYENLKDYEVEIRIRAVKKLELSSEEKSLWYLELLMLLSIQDEPINFLISILK